MTKKILVRKGATEDLDALVRLEMAGFSSDRFSPRQLRYLLTRANATTLVLEQDRKVRGAAILAWQKNSPVGRLYSIVIDPAFRGRGLGTRLLRACEKETVNRGCTQLRLEVRATNHRAIALYKGHGFRAAESLPGYYSDGANGLRMVKALAKREEARVRLKVPYYAQTLDFTCGPACLMMAMKALDPDLPLSRSFELRLWKEATLIFMTAGVGGCGPFGLAVAARRRGYEVRVILASRRTPFLSSVRKREKREVIRLVHEQLEEEARSLDVSADYSNFTFEDISRGMRKGAVPIVLISTYRLHKFKSPHWVVLTGFDGENVYFHDPYEGFYLPDKRQAQNVRVPIAEFLHMRRYGKDVTRSVIFVSGRRLPAKR